MRARIHTLYRQIEARDMETNKNISTYSAEEIARFSNMAETWWDPNGKFKPLHQINPIRINFILNHICEQYGRNPKDNKPLQELCVLDIGCGGGLLCEPMRRLGAKITGIDAGEKNVAIASLHAKQSNLDIDYQHQLPENLAKKGFTYDVVLNMEVIEHVSNVDLYLKASASLVKPGGLMILSTINRTIKSLVLAKIGAEYILRWLPIGTHDWRKFMKPSELVLALKTQNLDITNITGMVYNVFSDKWSLSDDLDVNYFLSAIKK